MGVSNNAILAFGFDMGEEGPEFLRDEDGEEIGWEDYLLDKAGVVRPQGAYQHESDAKSKEWIEYHKAVKAINKACPIEIEYHCSFDYPMTFIALKGTSTTARRGYPEKVKISEITEAKLKKFKEFCNEHKIKWQKPSWQIFSMNG